MMTCSDGGGSVDDGGLVNPAALIAKSADLDTSAITGAADGIRAMGSTVDTQTDQIKTTWTSTLPGCYQAPEQELVYALMTDPATASEELATTFTSMADYLDTYATALDGIKPKLSDWEKRAQDFRNEVIGGVMVGATEAKDANVGDYLSAFGHALIGQEENQKLVPWYEDGDTVEKNNNLLDEIAGLYADVSTAASTCATDINGLTSLPADKKAIPPIPKEAFTNPESPMPWGNPREEDRNCPESVGHGAYEFGKGTVEGLGSLISYNPETGDWGDWNNAGQAWMGTGNLLLSLAITASPTAQLLNGVLKATGNGDSDVSKWIDERNTMTATVGASLVGIDLQAEDPFHKWKEDGVATFTESFLNVGTMFIPGAGQVGAGLKAASIGARVAKITGAVADFAIPGGSFLVKGGLHTIPVLKNVFKFADEVPVNLLDDAAELGARAPKTINPSSWIKQVDDVVPDLPGRASDPKVSNALWNPPDVDAPRITSTQPHPVTPEGLSSEPGPATSHPQDGSSSQSASTVSEPTARPGTSTPEPAATTHPEPSAQPTSSGPHPDAATHPEPAPTATHPDTSTHPESGTEPTATAQPETTTHPETHPEPGAEPASTVTHPETASSPSTSAAADLTGHGTPGHAETGSPTTVTHHDPTTHTEQGGHPTDAPDGGRTSDQHGRQYSFDEDGRRHLPGDPDGTYRDRGGRLRDGHGWIPDANRPDHPDHPFVKAHKGTPLDVTVSDAERAAHDARVAARDAAHEGAQLAHQRLERLVESTGLPPSVLKGSTADVARAIKEQLDEGTITAQQRHSLIKALAHDRVASRMLTDVSERLGDKAAASVARMRGETSLIGSGGAGAGRFDQVTVAGNPPTLKFYEAKGGTAQLGGRTVDGVRHQQGSVGYLDDVLKSDSRLQDSVRQFIEANPNSPITQALKDGTIKVEYDLVQALPGGRIKVTPFVLDPSAFTLPTFK